MPIYVYKCSLCQTSVEELQKMTDPPPVICLHCGKKESMVKQMGVSNFELKGSRWAKDGYA